MAIECHIHILSKTYDRRKSCRGESSSSKGSGNWYNRYHKRDYDHPDVHEQKVSFRLEVFRTQGEPDCPEYGRHMAEPNESL